MHKLILPLFITTSLAFAEGASLSQHAQVMGQIKSRAAKFEDQKLPAIGQITATKYFLSQILAHGYENTIPGMVTAFFNEHPDTTITDFQKHQFAQMMEAERTYDGWYVFYHATLDEIGLFYDVISEYRARLAMRHSDDVAVLRALDDKFKDIPSVTEFMAMFERGGNINNYGQQNGINYAELGLSVNPFLFGNFEDLKSCSYCFFSKNLTLVPPDTESTFEAFIQKLGLSSKWQNFKSLAQPYYRNNGQMFQIFIHPDVLDKVGYAAKTGGNKFVFKIDHQDSYSIKELLTLLRKETNPLEQQLSSLQARLFLKPEIFHDPTKVKIIQYQSNPISPSNIKEYKAKLRDLIDADLDQWLEKHINIQPSLAGGGANKLQRAHRYTQSAQHGQTRKLSSLDSFELQNLNNLLNDNKIDDAIAFVRNHPDIDYNAQRSFDIYSPDRQSFIQRAALLPLSDKTLELIRLMDRDFDQDNAWFWNSILKSDNLTRIKRLVMFYKNKQLVLTKKNIGLKNMLDGNAGGNSINPYTYALDLRDTKEAFNLILSLMDINIPIPETISKIRIVEILINNDDYNNAALLFRDTQNHEIEPYAYALSLEASKQIKLVTALIQQNIVIPDSAPNNRTIYDILVNSGHLETAAKLFTPGKPPVIGDDGNPIDLYKDALKISNADEQIRRIKNLIDNGFPVNSKHSNKLFKLMANNSIYLAHLFRLNPKVLDDNNQPIEPYSYGLSLKNNEQSSQFLGGLAIFRVPIPADISKQVLDFLVANQNIHAARLFLNDQKIMDGDQPIEPYQYALTINDQKFQIQFISELSRFPGTLLPKEISWKILTLLIKNKATITAINLFKNERQVFDLNGQVINPYNFAKTIQDMAVKTDFINKLKQFKIPEIKGKS